MKTALPVLLALTVALSGCGQSRLNPMNWFGHSAPEPAQDAQAASGLAPKGGYQAALVDLRPLVAQITSLQLKKTEGGMIVEAIGLPPTQGWWNAALVAADGGRPENGEIHYSFVAKPPLPGSPDAKRVMDTASREITAAAYINNVRLSHVRKIVVTAAGNSRTITR